MTKEKKKERLLSPPVILESCVCQKAVTTVCMYIRWMNEWMREKEELKDAIAPISWILIVHKRFSLSPSPLLTYLREFFFPLSEETNLFVLLLNFRSLYIYICPTIAVTRMHDILSYSVMSCTVALTTYTHTYIYTYTYWASRRCLYQKVWIDIIYHTSFSIVFGR
jgi:hypothetical protein